MVVLILLANFICVIALFILNASKSTRIHVLEQDVALLKSQVSKLLECSAIYAKHLLKENNIPVDEDSDDDENEDEYEEDDEEDYRPSPRKSERQSYSSSSSYEKKEQVTYKIERMPPPYRLGYMLAGHSSDEVSAINQAQSIARFHPEDKVRVSEICGSRRSVIWSN